MLTAEWIILNAQLCHLLSAWSERQSSMKKTQVHWLLKRNTLVVEEYCYLGTALLSQSYLPGMWRLPAGRGHFRKGKCPREVGKGCLGTKHGNGGGGMKYNLFQTSPSHMAWKHQNAFWITRLAHKILFRWPLSSALGGTQKMSFRSFNSKCMCEFGSG